MRAPRRAASTAAAALLVALPATAAPTVGQGATRTAPAAVPAIVLAGPLAGAVAEPVPHPVPGAAAQPAPTGSDPAALAAGQPVSAAFAGEVVDGIPLPALTAYQKAAATLAVQDPSCGLDWA